MIQLYRIHGPRLAILIRKMKQPPTMYRLETSKRLAEQHSGGDWLLPAPDVKQQRLNAVNLGHVGDASVPVQSRRAMNRHPFLRYDVWRFDNSLKMKSSKSLGASFHYHVFAERMEIFYFISYAVDRDECRAGFACRHTASPWGCAF